MIESQLQLAMQERGSTQQQLAATQLTNRMLQVCLMIRITVLGHFSSQSHRIMIVNRPDRTGYMNEGILVGKS